MGTLRPINPHTASLIANPQATAHDYDNLTHKPQINGHELVGNKSSDDLELQGKLTAGDNVTIDENGVISAEGGTDDYNDLENKPTINGVEISGDIQTSYPYLRYEKIGDRTHYLYISPEDVFQKTRQFAFIHSDYSSSFGGLNPQNRRYPDEYPTDDNGILFGITNSYNDDSYKKTLVEPNYFFFSSVENAIYLRTDHYTYPDDVFVKGEWRKIGGGSQIVSGVVNANGTITFTDSDGNTFTTTGLSVIGADGVGIADVHIDGGGDLIIEYTTGHMENVGHVVGADGAPGAKGEKGDTGAQGAQGERGEKGEPGTNGKDGTNGSNGFSPVATVTQTASGATVSITDSTGTTTANISNGADGQDYVLTAQDKSDIADIVLSELPNADTMSF